MDKIQALISEESKASIKKLAELQSFFLQSVDHELRTPVAVIQGYAELLSEGGLGALEPEQQSAIFAITHRAHELRILVERITTLLAIKAQVAALSSLNLTDIVAGVVETYRTKATAAGLTLEAQWASELPLVTGQPYHLQQAVDCLVDNALKFTPPGGQIEVRLEADAKWVYLTITDTGIGIAPDKLSQIFDLFYQVDGSTTRKYSGLGLGLTVAKAVVEAYSGQIEVASQPGQGSRFTIRFPTLTSGTKAEQSPPKNTKLQRILIVDDEKAVALTLRESLKKFPNCEVVTATGGEKALQLLELQPFDLLITDYKMPDMDGLSLAGRVRQLYPQTIIIMITAHLNDELLEEAEGVSVQRILNKPVELSEFRRVASEALAGLAQT